MSTPTMCWTRLVHLVQPNAASPCRVQVFPMLMGEASPRVGAQSRYGSRGNPPGHRLSLPCRRDHRNCRQPLGAMATQFRSGRYDACYLRRTSAGAHTGTPAVWPGSGRTRPSPQVTGMRAAASRAAVEASPKSLSARPARGAPRRGRQPARPRRSTNRTRRPRPVAHPPRFRIG